MIATDAHILVYPFPSSGHVIPLLDLTHCFLNRGLTVTVLVTPNNLHLLHPLLSCYPSSRLQHLVLPPSEASPSSKNNLFAVLRSFRKLHYPILLDWFRSHSSPPVAIISDFFLGWTYELACEVGVPRLVFSPSGAFAFSLSASIWGEQPQNDDPENMDLMVSFPKVPNSPTCPWWQISHLYRIFKEGDSDSEFFRDCYLANFTSWGIVLNTFTELERVYLDHMRKNFGNDRVWAVGPLLPLDEDLMGPAMRGGSSSVPCHEVLTWLDAHKDDSVVYVCFGSRTVLTSTEIDVLAAALELSCVHFIWCLRQPNDKQVSSDEGKLPDGFEDGVAGRGFIIKGWAPQVAILRHRAVGAFLTHCGWNSVLEGIAAGAVMLTWPMGADQFINAQLLVDQMGVGIRIGEETHKIPEPAELARILEQSVEETRPEKVRAKKLREAALSAVKGGSSEKDLDEFVRRLNELKIESMSNGIKSRGDRDETINSEISET